MRVIYYSSLVWQTSRHEGLEELSVTVKGSRNQITENVSHRSILLTKLNSFSEVDECKVKAAMLLKKLPPHKARVLLSYLCRLCDISEQYRYFSDSHTSISHFKL